MPSSPVDVSAFDVEHWRLADVTDPVRALAVVLAKEAINRSQVVNKLMREVDATLDQLPALGVDAQTAREIALTITTSSWCAVSRAVELAASIGYTSRAQIDLESAYREVVKYSEIHGDDVLKHHGECAASSVAN